MKSNKTHKDSKSGQLVPKGDRLNWQPLNTARQMNVSVKRSVNNGRYLDASDLSKRSNNSNNSTLLP